MQPQKEEDLEPRIKKQSEGNNHSPLIKGLEATQSASVKKRVRPGKRERMAKREATVLEASASITLAPTAPDPVVVRKPLSERSSELNAGRPKVPIPVSAVSKTASTTTVTTEKASTKAAAWKTSWMTKGTSELVHTITSTSLKPHDTSITSEAGFETLCSYNWQNDGAIFVPGGPPKWTPPPLPIRLPQDTGRHFMDQNASRVPKYPFEPAFQALSIVNPGVSLDNVDIVANRNSLRKLLDFAAGRAQDPFCMGLDMINNTLVLSRKERSAQYMIHGAANSGYGHNFEKAFTTPEDDLSNSSSHHRVIRYRIGSLDCVVRFEVDAHYDDTDDPDRSDAPSGSGSLHVDDISNPTDRLIDKMGRLGINDPQVAKRSTRPFPNAKGATKAIPRGTFILPSKLAEIKARRSMPISQAMPQLWFGRTPWLIVGKHDKGVVHSVDIKDAGKEFSMWEKTHQDKLRKMVSLLTELKRSVSDMRRGVAVLVYDEKGGALKVFALKDTTGVLPTDIIKRHWSNADGVVN